MVDSGEETEVKADVENLVAILDAQTARLYELIDDLLAGDTDHQEGSADDR